MLLILFAIPLIGGIITLIVTEENAKKVALITSILTFIYTLFIWLLFDNNVYSSTGFQFITYLIGNWIMFGIDGISLYLILLTTLLTVLILLNGPFDKYYLFWILMSEFILLGVFSVLDILYFYVLFEMILIPLYYIMRRSMDIYKYRKNKVQRAINKLFGYTLFGSFVMLLGMILLYDQTGNTNYIYLLGITNELESNLISKIIFISFFIAFAVKVPVMPFHVWLPEAHSEAPTGGSMLLAGVLLKLGTYGIIRYLIPLFPTITLEFRPYIEILLIISILYSSLTILRQVEIKKFIAYSSISHMNICLLGLFSGEFDSLAGGYLIMINHGLVSAALFFCAGILFNRYSLRAIKYYRGLIVSMPVFSAFFFILNLSNIGFPPFASFLSEVLIFIGCFKHSVIISLLASISIILGGAYGIWFITRIVYGKAKANIVDKSGDNPSSNIIILSNDLTRKEFLILFVLLSLTLILGLFPNLVLEGIYFPLSIII